MACILPETGGVRHCMLRVRQDGEVQPADRALVPPFAVMDILAEVERLRSEGLQVWSLGAGEPRAGAPAVVRRAVAERLARGEGLGYTAPAGLWELRAALAGRYASRYGLQVEPEAVTVATGSSGAFVLAFLAAFAPGDRVALARPGYPAYRNILRALGVEVVEIACGPEHRYQPTPALLEAAAAAHGPLAGLIVASPANPTGTQLTREELAALAQWCAARGTRLVSDEIYHGVGGAGPLDSTAWEHDRQAIVISSFSKLWGMTGWRVGWMLLPEELRGPVDALAGNLALCPPSLAQHAALAALSPEAEAEAAQQNEQYVRNREQVLAALPGLLLTAPATPTGAFYVYADASALLARSGCADAAALCRRVLDEARVALAPGDDFDAVEGGRWVRLSFASDPAELTEALAHLAAWVAELP